MIYLDGTALCRFLPGVRHGEAWEEWVVEHDGELVTSPLGLTELRQAAALYPREQLAEVTAIVERVRLTVPQVRFSDDNVTISSHATAVLKPFAALHIGAAVGADRVDQIATYDPSVAHVAEIYRLKVVTPGLESGWYLTFEGPTDSWKPIALDAPYDPGAEFAVPALEPLRDPYAEALLEVEAIGTLRPVEADDTASDDAEGEAAVADAEPAEDVTVEPEGGAFGVEPGPEIEPGAVLREPAPEIEADGAVEPEGHSTVELLDEADAAVAVDALEGTDAVVEQIPFFAPAGDVDSVPELAPPLDVEAPRSPRAPEPSVASLGTSEGLSDGKKESENANDASRRRAEMIARLGQYQPKVQAWSGDERAAATPLADTPVAIPTAQASSGLPGGDERAVDSAPAELDARERTSIDAAVDSLAVPLGEPVRRPMLRQDPTPRSTTEVPRAATDQFPTIVPNFPLTVEIEDPTSYAPERFVASDAPLPGSHPFSRAGQTPAMEAAPLEPEMIPSLEPIPGDGAEVGPQFEYGEAVDQPEVPASSEEPKASGGRWRLGKGKDKSAPKEEKAREKRGKGSPAPSPAAAGPETDPGWKLEDILGPDGGRG